MTSFAEEVEKACSPAAALSDAEVFCRAVLPSTGYFCVQPLRQGRPGGARWLATHEEVARVAIDLDTEGAGDVYLAIASFSEGKERRQEAVRYKRDFYLDLDVGRGKALPDKRAAVLALKEFCLNSGIPFPAILVDSGNGLHAHWPLNRDLALVEWRNGAENLKRACARYGLHADHPVTGDAARILRIPGTTNRKDPQRPVPVRLLHSRQAHNAEALAASFARAADSNPPGATAANNDDLSAGLMSTASTEWFDDLPDDDRIIELTRMVHSLPDADADDRGMWIQTLAQISSVATVPWETRVDVAWEFSRRSDKAKSETRVSIAQRMGGLGDRTNVNALRNRARENGYLSPQPAHEDKFSVERALTGRYIHVAADDVYYDPERGLPLSKSALKERETWHMPRRANASERLDPVSLLRNSSHTVRCDAFGFHPGAGKVFEEDGRLLANLFRPHNPEPVRPTSAERRLLIRFLRHLFPRGSDLRWLAHLLDTYAFLVQHSGERVKFAMILVGAIEGSGKSTLMEDLPRLLFGLQNVVTVSTHELESQFTDWLAKAWIVVFAEVSLGKARDAARVANALKDNQTNEYLRIVEKGRAGRAQRNRTSFLGTSNDETSALHLSAFDRRSAIHATPAPIMPRVLSVELHAFLRSSRAAGVLRSLALQRDITHFDPNAAPPMTEAKRRMIAASRHPIHAELIDAFHSKDPPFHRDLVLVSDVRDFLCGCGVDVRNLTDRRIGEFLRAPPIGARRIEHQKRISTVHGIRRARLWVLRDFELWERASAKVIDQHLQDGTPPLVSVDARAVVQVPFGGPSAEPTAVAEPPAAARVACLRAAEPIADRPNEATVQ
jgi:hypothetical protein